MISTFDLFKIIMGLIISAFILLIAFRFAGSYIQIGESGREVSTIVSFKKAMDNVYTTGIAADFDMKDSNTILGYRPPYIETAVSPVDTSPIPVLLVPGEKLSVYRGEYDIGWWKFYFIEAVPETKIIFVLLKEDEKSWSVAGNVTSMLPSTEETNTKIKFGVGCNGTEFWFGWERGRFLDVIIPRLRMEGLGLNACENTEYFTEKGFRIVTISDQPENADFVIIPSDGGTGYVYIREVDGYEKYIYKNGLDIAALLLGGKEFYRYINGKFLNELEVAVDVSSKEYGLLMGDANFRKRCETAGFEFVGTLASIKEIIPKLKGDAGEGDVADFAYYMRESANKYMELERRGCA